MLSYAFTTLNQGGYEDIATEEFENIHNLFAAILAKGIGRQLKQGLYREYLNQKETVTAVRGKIDMPGTIQNRLARRQVLTCEYDELSENNLLNQILKTTVMGPDGQQRSSRSPRRRGRNPRRRPEPQPAPRPA